MTGMRGIGLGVSGTAVVCCVHDRVKREVTTEEQVIDLGRSVGQVYDRQQHKLWLCACCDNLFVDPTDTPRFCHICQHRSLQHPLGGLLPSPNERPL